VATQEANVSDGQSHAERLQRQSIVSAAERQAQRAHEQAMARIDNDARLVEARVRLASAWLPETVALCAIGSAGVGMFLGSLLTWAAVR
jgi:hypothetical protein